MRTFMFRIAIWREIEGPCGAQALALNTPMTTLHNLIMQVLSPREPLCLSIAASILTWIYKQTNHHRLNSRRDQVAHTSPPPVLGAASVFS